mmetsp:Transcript_8499/g.27093  ORF Transcript_8499/g.27093 Transcript_8499/m.27093 type:complete len:200 (+) Transcript_8499:1339-1938(+)
MSATTSTGCSTSVRVGGTYTTREVPSADSVDAKPMRARKPVALAAVSSDDDRPSMDRTNPRSSGMGRDCRFGVSSDSPLPLTMVTAPMRRPASTAKAVTTVFRATSTLVASVPVTSMRTLRVLRVIFDHSELMMGGRESTLPDASCTTGQTGESSMSGRNLRRCRSCRSTSKTPRPVRATDGVAEFRWTKEKASGSRAV